MDTLLLFADVHINERPLVVVVLNLIPSYYTFV